MEDNLNKGKDIEESKKNQKYDDDISLRIKELNAEFEALMKDIDIMKKRDPSESEDVFKAYSSINEPLKQANKKEPSYDVDEIMGRIDEYLAENYVNRPKKRAERLSRIKNKEEVVLSKYKPIVNDEVDVEAKRISEDKTFYHSLLESVNPKEEKPKEEKLKEEKPKAKTNNKPFDLEQVVNRINNILNDVNYPKANKLQFKKEEENKETTKPIIDETKKEPTILEKTNIIEKIEEKVKPIVIENVEPNKEEIKEITFTPIINRVDYTDLIVDNLNAILESNATLPRNVITFEKPKEKEKEVEKNNNEENNIQEEVIEEVKEKVIEEKTEEIKEDKSSLISLVEEMAKEQEVVKEDFSNKEVVKKERKPLINFSKIKDSAKLKAEKLSKPKKEMKTIIKEEKPNANNNDNNRPKGKTVTFVFAIIAILAVLVEICGFAGALIFANKLCEGKPDFTPADLDSADSSIIYDANGTQVMELGLYLRENIEYNNLPNCVIDAFISIEDSRFFQHFGFDIPRFTKAIIENLKSMSFGQGGSTFTMQLVKISYFQTDNGENSTMAAREGMSGVQRKMQEIILAIEAEKELSKKEILTLYLNKLNFGDNIRGVQKASEYYFGKNVDELTLNEAAFLAGIINAPNGNNPYNAAYGDVSYLENANARKNEVLDLMVYHGYISQEEANLNKAVRVENLLAGKHTKFAETNPYYQSFIDAVINEAEKVTGKSPYTTAMNIYTSMDPYMQEYVYNMQNNPEMFKDKYVFRHENQQNALVVMNNQTGELVALGGGRDQEDEARQFNRATDSYLNPGSSIKPVLEYALAFDKLGYATSHTVCDRPIFLYETDIVVANAYGQGYSGDMQIFEALARSLNTPAVQLLEEVIDKIDEEGVIKYCQSIGLDWCNKDTFDIQWAIGGRDCLVSPVQLAGAHGMLIHNGKYIAPHTINRIEYRGKYNETEDYIADTEGTQVISPAAAYMTAYCERNNITSGWISELNILRRDYPTFGKTGTTNFSEEAYEAFNLPDFAAKDQWLCTQTSNYTIVVWNGFDKVDENSYFTTTDENYNLKCKMGSILLDAVYDHFNYGPKELTMPDDCVQIEHVLGSFPYIQGTGAKGYISKNSEYATPIPASEYKKEDKVGKLYHMAMMIKEEGAYIHWDEYNSYLDDGTIDLTITSVSGKKTVFATGRSYYQRYNFINPEVFYATITAASGEVTEVESPTPTTMTQVAGEGPYTVCGWTSSNPNQVCSSTADYVN